MSDALTLYRVFDADGTLVCIGTHLPGELPQGASITAEEFDSETALFAAHAETLRDRPRMRT